MALSNGPDHDLLGPLVLTSANDATGPGVGRVDNFNPLDPPPWPLVGGSLILDPDQEKVWGRIGGAFVELGPGSGQPRFAPRYLIGNVPAGDSPSIYAANGFVYLPDAGDGQAVATALALAAATPGEVYVRPGVYDLGLPSAPVLPLAVPADTVLCGAGPSSVLRGPQAGPTLGVVRLFNGGEVARLRVETTDTGAGGGVALVTAAAGGSARATEIEAQLTRDLASGSTLRAAVGAEPGARLEATRCAVELVGTRTPAVPADALAAFRSDGAELSLIGCRSTGGDAGVVALSGGLAASVTDVGGRYEGFSVAGLAAVGGGAVVRVAASASAFTSAAAGAVGIWLLDGGSAPGGSVVGARVTLDSAPAAGTTGLLGAPQRLRVTGCELRAETGIDTSAGANNVAIGNVLEAQPGLALISSVSDEAAHNLAV